MTNDIVARLYDEQFAAPAWMRPTIHEAAAEIARLREHTPRLTLTDAERAAIEHFARLETSPRSADAAPAATLWCLLERTTEDCDRVAAGLALLRLTPEEREAVEIAVEYVGSAYQVEHYAAVLRGLLERLK